VVIRIWKGKMNLSSKPDRKIKVMRIIARLIIGGPTIHVVLLNSNINNEIFESVLVCGSPNPGEQSMLDFAIEHNIEPISIPEIVGVATFTLRDVKALVKLFRLIRRERPHIVHTHTAKAGFVGRLAARLAGVPIILHTYHGHVLHGYYSPLKTWFLRRMEQALGYFSDCIIAVSEQVKQDLVSYGVASPEKITVIPLGFDLQSFLDCEKYRGEFRRELGLNNGDRLIGIVGRIFPIKNHRLFLDSAVEVASQEPACRFVIVGMVPSVQRWSGVPASWGSPIRSFLPVGAEICRGYTPILMPWSSHLIMRALPFPSLRQWLREYLWLELT
jgi:glycosyltransferase involved in cell wall biosynthesis